MPDPRWLTALVLAPLFVFAVLYLPAPWFALMIGLPVAAGAWEWAGLSGYPAPGWRAASTLVAGLLMAWIYAPRGDLVIPLLAGASLAWLVVAAALYRQRRRAPLRWPPFGRLLSGAWVLIPAWLALVVLQERAPLAVLMLLLLVWAADSGAYFAGRRFGRRHLAPAISPGKTLEGLAGGIAAALLVALAGAWYQGLDAAAWPGLALFAVGVALVSVFGDLFESNWKRLASIKDSGGLLPGHGGVLDRIDSISAAAPLFTLGWLWWFAAAAP